MLEILSHLWPDFSALFLGRSTGLSALFWLVMAAIFSYAACFLVCSQYRVGQRLRALNSLLNGQTKEALASKRRETLQNALQSQPPEVGKLWREFDESLVSSGFGENGQLFNTLDAEHFFNPLTLARGLSASRLMAATPSFLVAIGVLGTFVGLTVGLESLDLDSRSEVDNLRDGIDGLIQGAAVAFMTSVWGVFMSLVLNFAEKVFERSALNGIRKLQQDIDGAAGQADPADFLYFSAGDRLMVGNDGKHFERGTRQGTFNLLVGVQPLGNGGARPEGKGITNPAKLDSTGCIKSRLNQGNQFRQFQAFGKLVLQISLPHWFWRRKNDRLNSGGPLLTGLVR